MISRLFRRRVGYRLPCGRYADPLAAYRSLLSGGCDDLLDKRESPSPSVWIDAETKLCNLVREAFLVPKFDPDSGTGYTDEMCLDVLESFLEYVAGKGWAGRPTLPTSVQPTADPADC